MARKRTTRSYSRAAKLGWKRRREREAFERRSRAAKLGWQRQRERAKPLHPTETVVSADGRYQWQRRSIVVLPDLLSDIAEGIIDPEPLDGIDLYSASDIIRAAKDIDEDTLLLRWSLTLREVRQIFDELAEELDPDLEYGELVLLECGTRHALVPIDLPAIAEALSALESNDERHVVHSSRLAREVSVHIGWVAAKLITRSAEEPHVEVQPPRTAKEPARGKTRKNSRVRHRGEKSRK